MFVFITHTFFLIKKYAKNQDCVRLARKNYGLTAKIFKLVPSELKQEKFFTPSFLVFRLTRQGQFMRARSARQKA